MLSPSDLLHLPYTPDLTEGGIAYALRSLAYTFEREGTLSVSGLRRIIANTAVELAFRRHLASQNIPYEVKAATPFTDRERFDVTLNGQRCDIKSFFISNRKQVEQIRRNPALLLNTPALVPSDTHAGEGHTYKDLYLFAYVTGLVAASQTELYKVIASKQPHYLVYIPPSAWRRPHIWNPLGALTLKSESEEELLVEVNGQDRAREAKRVTVSLPPKVKVRVEESFHSITSLHVRRIPEARVGLRCEAFSDPLLIPPAEWSNLWVYGSDIFLLGYMSYEEFGQRAKTLLPDSKVFQYERTKTKNLYVQAAELKPVGKLWQQGKSSAP